MKTQFKDFHLTSRNEHNEGLLTGLLLGAAIGACVALFFAPKSGKALRSKIRDAAGSQADTLNKALERVRDKAVHTAGIAKDSIGSVADDAESTVKDLAHKAEDEIQDSADHIADRFGK